MRYLGIPLSSMHLTCDDDNILIEKICGKIDSWRAKHLSFAGRVEKGKYFSKVAWNVLCLPLKEGGLGFKCMVVWSQVCPSKILWNIACKMDTLWIKWVHRHESFWAYKKRDHDPWYRKKLLKVRLCMNFLEFRRIGAGAKLSEVVFVSMPRLWRQIPRIRIVFEKLELVSLTDRVDRWIWKLSLDDQFSQISLWPHSD
ncbi:hypothetical protein LIER_40520 [Lithospermum erythrorhizon]|uniref:Uncharacterized protein n=1 Tax=Lithospermum erythrorhizon TaxID=34254 RepID=A0AAV3QY32_LITER